MISLRFYSFFIFFFNENHIFTWFYTPTQPFIIVTSITAMIVVRLWERKCTSCTHKTSEQRECRLTNSGVAVVWRELRLRQWRKFWRNAKYCTKMTYLSRFYLATISVKSDFFEFRQDFWWNFLRHWLTHNLLVYCNITFCAHGETKDTKVFDVTTSNIIS